MKKKAKKKIIRSPRTAPPRTRARCRYAAFLRGVSPMNAKMPELQRAFAAAGFEDVKTVLASGNVVFSAERAPERTLAARAEAAMTSTLGRSFPVIVRKIEALERLLTDDPYASFRLKPAEKRVVTFLRDPAKSHPELPIVLGQARILSVQQRDVFSAYVPTPGEAVFMVLLEKIFGKTITTRTWGTLEKVVKAALAPEATPSTRGKERTPSTRGRKRGAKRA